MSDDRKTEHAETLALWRAFLQQVSWTKVSDVSAVSFHLWPAGTPLHTILGWFDAQVSGGVWWLHRHPQGKKMGLRQQVAFRLSFISNELEDL